VSIPLHLPPFDQSRERIDVAPRHCRLDPRGGSTFLCTGGAGESSPYHALSYHPRKQFPQEAGQPLRLPNRWRKNPKACDLRGERSVWMAACGRVVDDRHRLESQVVRTPSRASVVAATWKNAAEKGPGAWFVF